MSADLSQREDPINTSLRVQQFRDQLRGQDCGRLEVWIAKGWIRGLRVIAQHQKRPLWELVQEAVKDYVAKHARIITVPKDRNR